MIKITKINECGHQDNQFQRICTGTCTFDICSKCYEKLTDLRKGIEFNIAKDYLAYIFISKDSIKYLEALKKEIKDYIDNYKFKFKQLEKVSSKISSMIGPIRLKKAFGDDN